MALVIRTLTGTVRVDGKDAEDWPAKDEYIHEERALSDKNGPEGGDRILLENQDTLIPHVRAYKWGGECRVEVDMHALLEPIPPIPPGIQAGNIRVWGQARFFEGASEDTGDQADIKPFGFSVPPWKYGDNPITWQLDMVNRATVGQDDWARVTFNLRNKSSD
ncbi:hypothetical protein ACFY8N_39735 [Streptomyces collinus]|uniref:hypothetical protein n=1 Tax=Streptomyces collinus TaxID=42684 RepID=UPI0036A3B585